MATSRSIRKIERSLVGRGKQQPAERWVRRRCLSVDDGGKSWKNVGSEFEPSARFDRSAHSMWFMSRRRDRLECRRRARALQTTTAARPEQC